MRTPMKVAGLALAIGVLLGCGDEQNDAPSTETESVSVPASFEGDASKILGFWRDANDYVWEFADDGGFTVEQATVDKGRYTFDGTTLVIDSDDDAAYCSGTHAEYEVRFEGDGDAAALEPIDDPCPQRRNTARSQPLVRVES